MNLHDIELEREARKAALAEARAVQRTEDLKRVNDLEIEHGDENVAVVHVGRYTPGIATLGVVRAIRKAELKRFRDRVRGDKPDYSAAAEEAGLSALLYPSKDSELWKATTEAVPGFLVRLGTAAVQLSAGLEQSEGKG